MTPNRLTRSNGPKMYPRYHHQSISEPHRQPPIGSPLKGLRIAKVLWDRVHRCRRLGYYSLLIVYVRSRWEVERQKKRFLLWVSTLPPTTAHRKMGTLTRIVDIIAGIVDMKIYINGIKIGEYYSAATLLLINSCSNK